MSTFEDDGDITIMQPSMFLLGAGASVEAGVPATFDMTQKIVEAMNRPARFQALAQALNFICGAIVAHDTALGGSPYAGLDVERVFAAVELLAERRTLEVTPFVASWDSAVDRLDRQRPPTMFGRNLQKTLVQPGGGGAHKAQSLVESLVRSMMGGGDGSVYRQLGDEMINQLRSVVATQRKRVRYLNPLVAAARHFDGLWIASLNYDLAIEQIAGADGVGVTTGIDDWIEDRSWHWTASDGIKLLKLHGSIDWCWEDLDNEDGHMPMRTLMVSDEPLSEERTPALVFGQRGKLRAEGPFLSLLAEFEARLTLARQLIVVGYSFRDQHINDIIRRWTRGDMTRKLLVIDPGVPARPTPTFDFRDQLIWHLSRSPVGGRVSVRPLKASEAFAKMTW